MFADTMVTLASFLYLKVEDEKELYTDITPPFQPKKRLKIGTFKAIQISQAISERFLFIVFDNALRQNVDEIYVTIFDKRPGQVLLIRLLELFGFKKWGIKKTPTGEELVFVRDFTGKVNKANPISSYPFISKEREVYFVSIDPEYHTELFPDSKLKTESLGPFIDSQPHRNCIRKVYVSHAPERNISPGEVIVFYRKGITPGRKIYEGVVTTIGIIESVNNSIKSEQELIKACQMRSVLTKDKLREFWNRNSIVKPFVVNFLYAYSFPKRVNLKRLLDIGVIKGFDKGQFPRGFGKIGWDNLQKILTESESDESIIGN